MAGAFGALGGDASAIKDNPAGLGIYRKSELSGTLNVLMQNTTSNWQYTSGNAKVNSYGYGDLYRVGPNSFSLVLASPTWRADNGSDGLQSSNWSFSYNRLRNFNRSLFSTSGPSMSSITDYMGYFSEGYNSYDLAYGVGYNNYTIDDLLNDPGIATLSIYGYQGYLMDSTGVGKWGSSIYSNMISPKFTRFEKGYLDEYSVGWAGNFSNIFYFGATLNFQSLNYSSATTYAENFGTEGSMSIGDTIYTKGTGMNLNIGTIISPVEFLRIGLSLHTPTIFDISERNYSTFHYDKNDLALETTYSGTIVSPEFPTPYQLQSPLRLNASVAFILGTKGLISAEYVYNHNTGTRLMNENGDSQAYQDENQGMKTALNDSRTIKIGGEYRLTENFSLRAGYANTNNETSPTAEKFLGLTTKSVDTSYFLHNSTNYLTAGFGYRESNWFIDFAFVNKTINETFYPYNTNNLVKDYQNNNLAVNPAKVITNNTNAVVTLGLKF